MGKTIEDGQKVDVWMLGKSFERIFRVLEEGDMVYFKKNSDRIKKMINLMLCTREKRASLLQIEFFLQVFSSEIEIELKFFRGNNEVQKYQSLVLI